MEELSKAVQLPDSEYKTIPGRTLFQLKDNLSHHLCSPCECRFEQVGRKHNDPWRLKKPKRLKRPSGQHDWDNFLQSGILSETISADFAGFCRYLKIHGPFYGWDTTTLPQSFFDNQVGLALNRASLYWEYRSQ